MKAIDTNIVLRLIVRDDFDQVEKAKSIVALPFVLLPTVILEAVWVLQTRYGFERGRIVEELAKVIALGTATVVSRIAIQWALERFSFGGDFADMLHVGLAAETEATHFVTFDKRVQRSVADADIIVETIG